MISTFEFANHVIGIIIDSDIDEALTKQVQGIILEKLKDHEKINLFFEPKAGNKVSFVSFLKDISFKMDHSGQFKKIAIVTNLEWCQNLNFINDLIMRAKVKHFSPEDRMAALNWIAE